jgi:thioredoxin-like negative regulator of GroEL
MVVGSVDKATARPGLIFFFSGSSGRCRRVEAFLAQVLQRRANHKTFKVYSVDIDKHPKLAERFDVGDVPVLCVLEDRTVRGRLEQPRNCREIARFLGPWLH